MYRFLIVAFTSFLIGSNLFATECNVNKAKKNMVKFISNAPIEDFEGVTDKIDGYIMIESIEKLAGSEMYFEIDLNSLDTGIGLRNRHMREFYLHTDKYPITHFTGNISKSKRDTDKRYIISVEGEIFIHGVTKKITIEGYITTNGYDSYRIQTKFVVALPDFNIEVPQLMFLKIDENMDMSLDFYVIEVKD